MRWVPPSLLGRWLGGRRPLAAAALGAAADSPLWELLHQPATDGLGAAALSAALWATAKEEAAAGAEEARAAWLAARAPPPPL